MCIYLSSASLFLHRYDWLEVHDGASESSPLIGTKMCGSNLPQNIKSTGNELFVKFHSDYSVTSTGYEVRVVAVGGMYAKTQIH